MDALYFGKRTTGDSWCILVFRDGQTHEDLWWTCTDTETTWAYAQGKGALESLGYTILSVTGDGFSGIRSAFFKIPFQMCLVHMERLIIRGTTRNPKTEAGEVLLALGKSLHTTDRKTLQLRISLYWKKYGSFLSETTTHPDGFWSYTHKELRKAARSLRELFPYLFTYESNPTIPKNTNSLEGHFSHVRDLIRVHRGASKQQQEKILHLIMLNSSTALRKSKKG
ncbi:MAG: hypothetical protein COU11_02280 [Candidatus Harrisonbacteria bacterium CG10_big_fil_rev_8_21_14_0_10_49_15]|uniref:Mutator family transposase n=1 Tax=Candidatus Harrisonbacteria bacterium CG10_big_fil_rev_8_21_14_0_10_49_15 TaxID=1974587 RepID=A0A2H0UMN8_9BACT|nr:MAG: hypothetical protein COU11_02280 [Candidatus Harrisonbacteria bacterium CG10_big_fil_rev_8_21_14_0_10_49_15]